jgi:hypothetical protein
MNFIDPAPPERIFIHPDYKRPSIFIPSRMTDNKFIDAGYENQFAGLPAEMRKALVEGDWDAVVGQAVPVTREQHRVRRFKPPKHWTRFMAMDWGTAAPFSVGWYCVSEGAELIAKDGWPSVYLPSGAVIRYREWYGWGGKANQGCRMESPAVAKRILEIEKEAEEVIDYRIADSAMWASTDGPSTAERMSDATGGRLSLRSTGSKDRKAMYAEMIARLAGEEGRPMFYVTEDCLHFWRTVPILTFDETDPDKGPNTKLEDHVYDEVSYALRSRPYVMTEDDRWMEQNRFAMREALAGKPGGVRNPYATR